MPQSGSRAGAGAAPALRLALDVPDDHAIDPRALTAALAAAVRRAGGEVRRRRGWIRMGDPRERVAGAGQAAGPAASAATRAQGGHSRWGLVGGLARHPRGASRSARSRARSCLARPVGPGLLTPGSALRMEKGYVVPRGDGRYVLGATVEERGFDTTVTAGAVFELLRDASELVPGVSELVLDELSAGLRPGTPDNLPVIGPGAVAGLHWATGHYRNGILLAPITGELGDRAGWR